MKYSQILKPKRKKQHRYWIQTTMKQKLVQSTKRALSLPIFSLGLVADSCEIQNPHENEIFIYSKFSVQKFSPYLLKSLFIHWYQSIHRRGCMWFLNIITIIKQGFMSVMGRFYLTTKSRKQFTVCKWYWAADSKWNFLKCQMNIVEVFEIESSSKFLY